MYISRLIPRSTSLPDCAPREFAPHVQACPPLRSIPGVIAGTSIIWEEVQDLAVVVNIPKGEVLYPDPDTIPPFIYLKRGKLCINFIDEEGDELVLHYILPGSASYEGFYCTAGQIASMPVKALEDCTIYMFDSRLTFQDYLNINPLLVRNLMYSQGVKNLAYSKLSMINSHRTPLARVALLLFEMHKTWRRNVFSPLISQVEMARLLHLHKVTVSNAISRLKAEGILLSFTKREVVLSQPERLMSSALSATQKN